MPEQSYHEAVADAYREALAYDEDTFLIGEDVEHSLLGLTTGLVEEFGNDRVRDTPISEQAFHGLGVGAAMGGKRPIIEHEINTLNYLAMDQIVNNANKLRYMTGGQVTIPMTLSIPAAGVPGSIAAQHSDANWPMLMNMGVKTVVPSTPYDAKGLFHSAVAEDDLVAVYFPADVMGQTGDVPNNRYTVPLGEADVKKTGSDVTIVGVGETVRYAMDVAANLSGEISIEVVDPRTLLPFDEETVFESVRKTQRVIVTDGANRTCGAAAEIAARISNRCIWDLDAPVKRVTRGDVTVSNSPSEERAALPDRETIERAVQDIIY